MKQYIANFMRYKDLLRELVVRDVKVKYKNSILGFLWTLLNPLMMMIVMTVVFSNLFARFSANGNYAMYVISGQVIFSFFSEATSMSMQSIIQSGSLIKKIYIPKYIFPVSRVTSSLVNLLFSMVAVTIVAIATRQTISWTVVFCILSILYVYLFAMGVSLILSALAVFFRDMVHLYSVIIFAWMYWTPVVYPISIIPDNYMWFFRLNPMMYIVGHFREALLDGKIPTLQMNLTCIISCVVTLAIGLYVFYKSQDKFVLYI